MLRRGRGQAAPPSAGGLMSSERMGRIIAYTRRPCRIRSATPPDPGSRPQRREDDHR
jgi:hypothetical protein